MKNFIKCFAILGIITTGLACEKKSSNDSSQPTSAPAAEISPAPSLAADVPVVVNAALVATGNAVMTSTVIDRRSAVGEMPAGAGAMTWEEIIAAYPVLADRVIFLGTIDKVVETDARTFDLYAGGSVVMTLKYTEAGDALVVHSSSHAGFSADLITFESTVAEQTQGAVVDSLDFMMSACNVVQAPQEQEQAQEPADKMQEQEQSGKEAPAKEAQVAKEEPKKEEPKQECASIIASIVLKQVVEKQEQKQEVKEPAPAKEEPKQEPKQEQEQKEPVAPQEQKQG